MSGVPGEQLCDPTSRSARKAKRRRERGSLVPVPKVMLPAAAGVVAIASQWVATGTFSRLELAQLVLTAGYAAIGWLAPRSNSGD